jgi:hypothetical protein
MQFRQLKRREFITLLGGRGSVVAGGRGRIRRVGVLMSFTSVACCNDPRGH